ncbi:MAG: DUF1957 domain-containing protein, partial [Armatimonadetes bacterium]|nr:DUF1957 domain-containing protein [Armatimonadota bacterium]
ALLADHGAGHDDSMRALVKQAARELLLLQASDWPFLVTTDSAPDYSAQRLVAHHSDYKRVADMARRYGRGEILSDDDWAWLVQLQERDRPFPDVDPESFGAIRHPATRA